MRWLLTLSGGLLLAMACGGQTPSSDDAGAGSGVDVAALRLQAEGIFGPLPAEVGNAEASARSARRVSRPSGAPA